MRTDITYHKTDADRMKLCIRGLRGEGRLNVASHGTYFTLNINTCLDHRVNVFSERNLSTETMNEIRLMLKKSTKWVFTDESL